MKKFLAVYLGTPQSFAKWENLNEAARKEREAAGMKAWGKWGETHSKAIVDMGAPLGKTKHVDEKGITDIKNAMAAYSVVEAESHEEAAKIFLNHPHFTIFPGESVEIMECLPLPKM